MSTYRKRVELPGSLSGIQRGRLQVFADWEDGCGVEVLMALDIVREEVADAIDGTHTMASSLTGRREET